MSNETNLNFKHSVPGELTLAISGNLDVVSVGRIWNKVIKVLKEKLPQNLVVDVSEVQYCDGTGIGFLTELTRQQVNKGRKVAINGLKEENQKQLDMFIGEKPFEVTPPKDEKISFVEKIGKQGKVFFDDMYQQVAFTGQLTIQLLGAIKNPKYVRWHDMWRVVQKSGTDAIIIVCLINFLMGLILAFQAAIPMQQIGTEVFVAELVAFSLIRVLGALMTAIVVLGRTGSAFAAEIGTMKVNEEINALKTMGLDPVRFLVTNRVLGLIIAMPILTLFAYVAGLLGGSLVYASFGYSPFIYFDRIFNAVVLHDFFGGWIKSFVFGLLVASIGCLRGLQTKTGASAVGDSATSSVVSGLVLIIATEGIFGLIYNILGI